MDLENYKLEDSLGYIVNNTNRELNLRLFRNIKERGVDITPEQMGVLFHLWNKDGICQQELCNLTNRDNPGITRILDNLEKGGFVSRKPHPSDRRINLIYLNENGKCLQAALIKSSIITLEEALKDIPAKDIEICKEVLNKVFGNLKK